MPESRHISSPGTLRAVFAAWGLALLAAASLAMAVGWLQLWRIDRAQSLSQSDQQLDQLYELIVPLYDERRSLVEAKLHGGKPFQGEAYDVNLGQDPFVEADERSIFRFTRSAATAPAVTTVLRSRLDGADIDSRFAGWIVRLKFVNDRLQGASAYNPARAALRKPITAAPTVQRFAEGLLVLAAGVAILCLIAAGPLGDRWRRQVAAIGLAAAVLVVVIGCLHPAMHTRAVLYSQTSLAAWSLVIAALAVSALIPNRVRRSDEPLRCRCGYDLTGNVSGVCPECGRPTARGRVDRWAEQADAIEHVRVAPTRFTGVCFLAPNLTEAKQADTSGPLSPWRSQPRQFASVLAGATLACYRFRMTDPRPNSDDEEEMSPREYEDATPTADGVGSDWNGSSDGIAADAAEGVAWVCPRCAHTFAPSAVESGEDGLTACPECGYRSSYADDVSDADRELALRMEVEQRTREAQLNDIHVKQVLTERRSLFRMRSYFVALGVTAAVAAGQLGIWSNQRLNRGGFDLFVAGYIAAIVGLVIAVLFCLGRIRRYNAELAVPAQTDPVAPPDFSTLSDGSQRLDAAAKNLQRLSERNS